MKVRKKIRKKSIFKVFPVILLLLVVICSPEKIFAAGNTQEEQSTNSSEAEQSVARINISDRNMVSVEIDKVSFVYNGSERKPSVTVTCLKPVKQKLKKGVDYTVTYSTNKGIGQGKVKITGIGAYKGSETKTFKINPAKVTDVKVASMTVNSIKLTWTSVKQADKYQVYRYDSSRKEWVKEKTVAANSATIKKLTAGTAYKFRIRAYAKSDSGTQAVHTYYGDYSSVKSTGTRPEKVTLTKAGWSGSKSVKVTWKALSKGSGYQISYSTVKNFKSGVKNVLVSGRAKTAKTISGLNPAKTYYFKVRAYKTINDKKVYGAYSAVKAVKPSFSWKEKSQKIYCYSADGKKITGFKKIDGKYYYFDKSGVQHTGWQKINNNYYFFQIANGKKGYMLKNKKVDGVTLQKNGKAVLTADSRSKLNVLIKANKIMEKATKPTMTKSQKLRACFDYSITKFLYRGSPKFNKTTNWDRDYALNMFDQGHGSCYAYGAAFAYLANAVGYTDVCVVSSGGHGWAEVNGKIYDPSWHITDKKHNYYAMDPDLSGKDGRPGYKRNRVYVKKI